MRILGGQSSPLGATLGADGVNFAIYSENATSVTLCLFDERGEETQLPLTERTAFVWHGFVAGVKPGQKYAYRVDGPNEPARGLRFDAGKLLLDPYAKAVTSDLKGVVVDTSFDWGDDKPPATPFHQSIIYETHVRGISLRHPEVPDELRGTYTALGCPPIIEYLKQLGITAVELMPVHRFVDEQMLVDEGKRNYWGYNTIGFFAPEIRYRSKDQPGSEIAEFKAMVKALHKAGIEVILDVVYNHTAEGNHLGPMLSFKGIDNPTYYRLAEDPQYYYDFTGTGNSLNVRHPQTLQLIMDSLRYWITEMHVDGFRFDLASALARGLYEVDQLSSFFTIVHQDPVISQVKLIAEPWDVGERGYQVGNFPVRWAEWNGRYRDTIRAFWSGDGGKTADLGYRLTGSSDLYQNDGRKPSASINFVTSHDGATLSDWVNKPGSIGRKSPSDTRRRRQHRNLLATMLLSQGTPMLLGGDEFGRSQQGDENPYNRDDEVSWYDWRWQSSQRSLLAFTKEMIRLRLAHPALHRAKFFQKREIHGEAVADIIWYRHDGEVMTEADWNNPITHSLALYLDGRGIGDTDPQGHPLLDDDLLLVLNASELKLSFKLPPGKWQLLVDTIDEVPKRRAVEGHTETVPGSLQLLSRAVTP